MKITRLRTNHLTNPLGYGIPIDDKLRKDVNIMCNLSQGIWPVESGKQYIG